jgi:predicted O-linked N-acetylglucosamine transferase (SPINDLY family)
MFPVLQQQADMLWAEKNYEQATALYEQLVAEHPDIRAYYWRLGLLNLLQGQESEAQLVWAMAMADADLEQAEQWIEELSQVLLLEAQQQEQIGETQTAWMIRRHLQEIHPNDIENLLQTLQLSLDLEQVDEGQVRVLTDLLSAGSSPRVPSDLLWQVVKLLVIRFPEQEFVLELIAASLPWAKNPSEWIDGLLETAIDLGKTPDDAVLSSRYAEFVLQLDPDNLSALLRLSLFYQDEFKFKEGIETARRYLSGCQTPLQKVLGNALVLRGLMNTGAQWQEAQATLNQETELLKAFLATYQPEAGTLLSGSILCRSLFFYPYLTDTPRATRPLQNQIASLFQSSLQTFIREYRENYTPYPSAPLVRPVERKKIRVGYISQCLRMHSVGWLSRWIFKHFDRDRFEVYAYFNQMKKVEPFSKQWFADPATVACCIEGDNLGIAKCIQQDEIDILVDLDSLTSDNTCGVMALKPAPVQVTWLGLDATGLPAIDYFIADPYVLPQEAEQYYAEQIWRLPQTYIAVDGFEVGVPTLRRDRLGIAHNAVVFFTSQFAYKRYPETIRMQLQILREVANSYLLVKGLGDEQGIQTLFEQLAEEAGVGSDRLRFLPRDANELIHRANLGIADVVLDTFPYNGATTTLETLWMGIPIVTLVGQQFASRNSYTMMLNASITEGIAHTPEDYVAWGVRLGQDAELRQQISWKLRQSRQTAPLWNAAQFTRELEHAYEQMWQHYLETR